MSAPGSRKTDTTGRSTGARKTSRHTKIGGQFAPREIEMLESPAHRVLSLTELRILARLEIELGHHGGADNGRLPCSWDDFRRYGARRDSIGSALRALQSLGFVEITQEGRAGNAEWRKPTLYRLTFRPTHTSGPTHEWRKIETLEDAERIAAGARSVPKRDQQKGGTKNRTPVHKTRPMAGPETGPAEGNSQSRKGSTKVSPETGLLSRSRGAELRSRDKRADQRARARTGGHDNASARWDIADAERYLSDVTAHLKAGWGCRLLQAETDALRQITIAESLPPDCREAAARLLDLIEGAAA